MATRAQAPYRMYTIRGFAGGLNKAVSSFDLSDSELRDVKNVQFGLKGSIVPRKGLRWYDSSAGDHLGAGRNIPIKNIYRYNKIDGTRELIIQGGRWIYGDNNTNAFSDLFSMNEAGDGFIHFAQWRDTVYALSENGLTQTYNRGSTPLTRTAYAHGSRGTTVGTNKSSMMLDPVENTGKPGLFKSGKEYWYRFTFERFHGNDFMCETVPTNQLSFFFNSQGDPSGSVKVYDNKKVTITTDDVIVALKKHETNLIIEGGSIPPYSFPATTDVKNINIYRTLGQPTTDEDIDNLSEEPNFYFIGQVAVEDYNNADEADVLFEDLGSPYVGNTIQYNKMGVPPFCRYGVMHKTRMWRAYTRLIVSPYDGVAAVKWSTLQTNVEPYRLYFSDYREPDSVRHNSWLDVGPEDGEGITGLVSWKNKALFVFKPNSIWAVFGGDDESIDSLGRTTGKLNLVKEQIDTAYGCIAPETIAAGEGGIIFLSNRGVEFFNGVQVIPMRSEIIKPLLDDIPPHLRTRAAGAYLSKDRKYMLAISNASVDASRSTVVLEYDFFTKTWTKHQYGTSATGFGLNKIIEIKRGDETGQIIASLELEGAVQVSAGAVQIIGDVNYENLSNAAVTWFAQTKFFDCGVPELDKNFLKLIVRHTSPQALTIDYDIDEGAVTGTKTIPTSGTHTWNESGLNWQGSPIEDSTHTWQGLVQAETVVHLPPNLTGRRISLKFSGSSLISGTEIQGLTIVYEPELRVA